MDAGSDMVLTFAPQPKNDTMADSAPSNPMNEPFEAVLVHRIECLFLRIRLRRTNAERKLLVASGQAFSLASFERELPQVHPNVDHTKDASLDAKQVDLI